MFQNSVEWLAGAPTSIGSTANHLLSAIPPADRAALEACMQTTRVKAGDTLFQMDSPLSTVHFPLTAVISLLIVTPNGGSSAVGIVGPEGVIGIDVALGSSRSASGAVVCQPGTIASVPSIAITRRIEVSADARHILLAYAHALYTEVSHSVLCCQQHKLEQRFCHCLLKISDRAMSPEVDLSHEELGKMLGVRRESVTNVASRMRRQGLIEYRRGRIIVLDRPALEQHACECHFAVPRSANTWAAPKRPRVEVHRPKALLNADRFRAPPAAAVYG